MKTIPADFVLTARSLSGDRIRGWAWALALSLVIVLGWLGWFVFSRVGVYEVSDQARLEVGSGGAGGYPTEAVVDGLLTRIHVAVGQEVDAGDVLFDMDATSHRHALAAATADRDALVNQIDALKNELAMHTRSLEEWRASTVIALAEAEAKWDEARAAVAFSDATVAHLKELHGRGGATDREVQFAEADREQRHFAAVAAELGIGRLAKEQTTRTTERQAGIESLQREAKRLDGKLQQSLAAIAGLAHEVEVRSVRAPVGGVVGETAPLSVGMHVNAGQRLATVLPGEKLVARALFTPASALGKIKKGQRARMRLAGFPWSEYGSVPATVSRVSREMRDGFVEVEFDLDTGVNPGVVFQHGLPGVVEVEVERVSPASLLLRSVGRRLRSDQVTPKNTESGKGQA